MHLLISLPVTLTHFGKYIAMIVFISLAGVINKSKFPFSTKIFYNFHDWSRQKQLTYPSDLLRVCELSQNARYKKKSPFLFLSSLSNSPYVLMAILYAFSEYIHIYIIIIILGGTLITFKEI